MSLDLSARYAVKGWSGIAFFIHGFPKKFEADICYLTDPDTGEEYTCTTGEGEWVEQDETCGRVLVVMVGDDRKHEVDVEDLKQLADEDYCGTCGQIGCGHGNL